MAIDQNVLTTLTGVIQDAVNKQIKGFTTQTPGHADYFNYILQQLLDNDTTIAEDTAKVVKDIRINLMELKIQYETDKAAEATGVNSGMFTETFLNLDDITLLNGATKYDNVNMKVYLA
ncbi:hypothetical protein [Brevibacillus fulvus]|uniref:Uncharacterized protein n=1 Tax=Brevibacillus fulvus TaxID=1125967 RepID=A0A938Y3B3_9BACL|nr:hypothetical protein [Brevibacillus fulvus]MBM7591186.1 hypothetical protein [Brevibacillus fulvus]